MCDLNALRRPRLLGMTPEHVRAPMPLPFCRACVEMVVYDRSFVADKPEYAQRPCKGGGDDAAAMPGLRHRHDNDGHRHGGLRFALKATRSALKENPSVVRTAVTAKTRLCDIARLPAPTARAISCCPPPFWSVPRGGWGRPLSCLHSRRLAAAKRPMSTVA